MENHRSENLVEISQLRKCYGSLEVLKGIDLSIKKSEVVSIIGKSGQGENNHVNKMDDCQKHNRRQEFYVGVMT